MAHPYPEIPKVPPPPALELNKGRTSKVDGRVNRVRVRVSPCSLPSLSVPFCACQAGYEALRASGEPSETRRHQKEAHCARGTFNFSNSQVTGTPLQADTWTDGWIGRLDRSTINNAFSFSHHYYTTHFAGHSTDVNPLFSLFALEVILSAAFGMQADIQSNPDSDTVEKAKNVFRTPLWVRAFSMFPFSDYFSKKLNLSPLNHTDYFIRMARVIYDARKAQKTPSRKDLLQLMLEAQKQQIEGKRMSDEEVSAQSVIFMVAGFETTGSTLSYMAYLLAAHPEVQEKLL